MTTHTAAHTRNQPAPARPVTAPAAAPPTAGAAPPGTRKQRPGTTRRTLGAYGEDLAARLLTDAGMTVLSRNWRAGRTGEIDIVAEDGDTLVICEVKTRRDQNFQHPMAAVTPAKAQRLRLLAEQWLHENGGPPPGGVRIDLVGITVPRHGTPLVEHAKGVA